MSLLQSIVYVSSASREMSVDELEALLKDARAENLKSDVTGVLLCDGGNFMQCFEGPERSIPHIYGRIRASHQHHNIIELMNERVERRSFAGWEMALAQPTSSELLALSTARWTGQAVGTVSDSPGGDGLGLMKALWQGTRR